MRITGNGDDDHRESPLSQESFGGKILRHPVHIASASENQTELCSSPFLHVSMFILSAHRIVWPTAKVSYFTTSSPVHKYYYQHTQKFVSRSF